MQTLDHLIYLMDLKEREGKSALLLCFCFPLLTHSPLTVSPHMPLTDSRKPFSLHQSCSADTVETYARFAPCRSFAFAASATLLSVLRTCSPLLLPLLLLVLSSPLDAEEDDVMLIVCWSRLFQSFSGLGGASMLR